MTHSLRALGLIPLLLSLESATAFAQCPAGRWVTLAPLNEPRQELAAAQLDGMIYAVAGLAGSATANEIYDPASDHWSFGADFPTPTDHAWAVAFHVASRGSRCCATAAVLPHREPPPSFVGRL